MKSEKAREFIDGCINNLTVDMADHAERQLRLAMTHTAELAEQEAKRWLRHGRGIQYELIKSPIIKRELNRSMNYYILRRVAELKQKRR